MKGKINKYWQLFKKKTLEYVVTNRLFLYYVLLSIVSTTLVRHFTINSGVFKPFITDLGIILLVGSFGYFIKPKNQFRYYFVWIIIFTVLCIVSSVYYTFYTSFSSFGELATLSQVETVTGSIFDKLRFVDVMYFLTPVIFYLIHLKLASGTYYHFITRIENRKRMVIGTFLVGLLFIAYSFAVATKTDYSRLSKQWNRVYIVERFGIITYQFNDLIQSLTPKFGSLFGYEEALDNFNQYFEEKPKHEDNKYTNILKGYNIVFVHMESVQTFLMDLEFNGQEVTPNLNALAKEGMFFTNFYPQVSTGTSSDTEFTLLTGLMPAASGTVFVSYYNREYFTIPKYLKEVGYYPFSMHGNFVSMWGRNKAHPSLGYEGMYFEDSFTYTPDDVVNLGINDYKFFEQAVPIMEQIEATHENYMGTVITLSNHSPFSSAASVSDYDLTQEYTVVDATTGEEKTYTSDFLATTPVGEYLKSVHYSDGALGDFIKYIKESDSFDNTLFVFYGDHDAKLSRKELNYLYNLNLETNTVYTEEDEEYTEYDYFAHELNKKTPLILWTKNKKLSSVFKGEINYTMGMYDVSTTILNMFGLYNKYSVGSDIFNTKYDNMVVFPNGNVLTSNFYYNNSTGEYKILNNKFTMDDEYLENIRSVGEKKLEVSNAIIVYNLLEKVSMTGE